MNLFQTIFFNVVLLIFPILIYLIYLSTNKNITESSKKTYFSLTLISSFFMIYNYGISEPKIIPILMLSSISILSYLEDRYIISNIFSIIIICTYILEYNNVIFLLIGYVLISILYLIK